jgi:hypothetical protein
MNLGIGTGAAHFFSGIICFEFSVLCLCSVLYSVQCITYKLRKITGTKKKELISSKQRIGSSPSNPDHRGERLTERNTAAAFNIQLTGGDGKSCLHEGVELIAVALNCIRVRDRKKQLPA